MAYRPRGSYRTQYDTIGPMAHIIEESTSPIYIGTSGTYVVSSSPGWGGPGYELVGLIKSNLVGAWKSGGVARVIVGQSNWHRSNFHLKT